jgi:hypothetical protein
MSFLFMALIDFQREYVIIPVVVLALSFSIAKVLRPAATGKLGGARNYPAIIALVIAGLFLLSGAGMLWFHYSSIGTTLNPRTQFLLQVLFAATMFFAMLTGMVAKYFHELSKAGKTFADARIADLLVPLTVSVVIFFTVWGTVAGQPTGFISVGLAVQNGFFWQDVLGRVTP